MNWQELWEELRSRYEYLPRLEVLVFEVVVVVGAFLTYRYLNARIERTAQHFVLLAIGVFLYEFFTSPMWQVTGLGFWAYVYRDVSWIYTLAWTSLILLVVYFVDRVLKPPAGWRRFALYLLIVTPFSLLLEAVGLWLGVRGYSPETLAAAGPLRIPLLDVPLAGLYYAPVFMGLVLTFYKHWLPVIEPGPAPVVHPWWVKRLGLLVVGVLLFEFAVEPMATNSRFPSWSYIYHDMTLIMTGFWVALVGLCFLIVDRFLHRADYRLRFAAILALATIIATPIEGWYLAEGYRTYGPSAIEAFSGIKTLIGGIPIEVVAAIPIYLSLAIAFVRYWDGNVDQSLSMTPRGRPASENLSIAAATPGQGAGAAMQRS